MYRGALVHNCARDGHVWQLTLTGDPARCHYCHAIEETTGAPTAAHAAA